MPTYPFGNAELAFGRPQTLTQNLNSGCASMLRLEAAKTSFIVSLAQVSASTILCAGGLWIWT